jgi:uncharacterized membrane protein
MKLGSKHVGALLGLGFGWLAVQYGPFKAVFVAAVVGIGWFIGRVLDGETDISDYVRRRGPEEME